MEAGSSGNLLPKTTAATHRPLNDLPTNTSCRLPWSRQPRGPAAPSPAATPSAGHHGAVAEQTGQAGIEGLGLQRSNFGGSLLFPGAQL